ncbi:MAG: NUDIX domain-containing protein [bacterium]|nr:NUDIX domain-containing protein [bacterium]
MDPKTQEYKFLLVKRFALSKKIERIAPKGKIHPAETPEQAALREIQEETGLLKEHLQIKQLIDTISLQLYNEGGVLGVDKDITYYLVKYTGDPEQVKIAQAE